MFTDPTGNLPKWLEKTIDLAIYAVSAKISLIVGRIRTCASYIRNPTTPIVNEAEGIATAATTFGAINNTVNKGYYELFASEESDLMSNSYVNQGYISRWDRLDYTKKQTQQGTYNETAWLYFSEYNLHMYGWFALGWAYEKDYGVISDYAQSASEANIIVGQEDGNEKVRIFTRLIGYLGL